MSTEPKSRPIRIDLVGVNARARERFEAVFQGPGAGAYMVVNPSVAEIAIIDLDGTNGQSVWHQYRRRFPNRPTILFSATESPAGRYNGFLPRPIRISELLATIDDIRHHLDGADRGEVLLLATELLGSTEPETIRLLESKTPPREEGPDQTSTSRIALIAADPQWASSNHPLTEPVLELVNSIGTTNDAANGDLGRGAAEEARRHSGHAPCCAHAPENPTVKAEHSDNNSEQTCRLFMGLKIATGNDDLRFPDPTPGELQTNTTANASDYQDPFTEETLGKVSNVDLNDAIQAQALLLPVHDRLLGFVQNALKKSRQYQKPVALRLDNGNVILYALQDRVMATHQNTHLKQLATKRFDPQDVQMHVTRLPPLEPGMHGWPWETLDAFLWKVALWTYRGRLPAETQVDKRVYLIHWPNLTRLHPVPEAMRIAALWSEQPMTLGYTATTLGVPQRYVFAFYSAAHTIGLAGQAQRETDYLFQESPAYQKGKGRLMSAMIARLRAIVNS